MEEIWKEIKGYEGLYEISSLGRVRRTNPQIKYLTIYVGTNGYCRTTLVKNGKKKYFRVHRLMGIAFLENTENKTDINHIDGNKQNNNISNLEWASRTENMIHAVKLGLKSVGENCSFAKLKEESVKKILDLFYTKNISILELQKRFNVSRGCIRGIINNTRWKHIKRPEISNKKTI